MTETGFFIDTLDAYRDRICLIEESGRVHSYGEVLAAAEAVYRGVPEGRKLVFIAGTNCVETIFAYVGALRLGHVVHLLDPGRPDTNQALIDQYRPNLVVTCAPAGIDIETVNPEPIPLADDLAVLLSTSGSTGTAKFVKLSYGNVDANTRSICEYLGMTADDRSITTLKPFYSYGFSVVNTHLCIGGALLVTDRSVQEEELLSLINEHRITNFAGVPYTYELLKKLSVDWSRFPSLRFLTQAGGRLAPALVTEFSEIGRAHGWTFFVMYGQTEASPRMSYLPPEFATRYPNAIGVPVPGGRMDIVDDDRNVVEEPDVEGELRYTGPNVMRGYATSLAELGYLEDIDALYTGDLARRNADGLFFITGRKARFVKPFGLRLSLDDVESFVTTMVGTAAVVGTDSQIRVFVAGECDRNGLVDTLAARYKLTRETFAVTAPAEIPRLANGKVDYRTLNGTESGLREDESAFWFVNFARSLTLNFFDILTGRETQVSSVLEAFETVFPRKEVTYDESFATLQGDSMSFMNIALSLEEYLGYIPDNWQYKSIRDLEALKTHSAA